MNKIVNINLGGYPFTIDENAYDRLQAYLQSIHKHFRNTEGYEEITTDIEARLAELFQERLGNRPIVNLKDVEEVTAKMGMPEDFAAEGSTEEKTSKKKKTAAGDYKTGKRLYRNSEEEVIAGVCSGIAAYFGIADPVWVRLLFVLLAISGGFGVPIYLILWAILPKAETAGDRLAMRGEPINASNIARIIQEEFEHISRKVNEFGSELGVKGKEAGENAKAAYAAEDVGKMVKKVVDGLGIAIRNLINALAKIWKPILFLAALVLTLIFVGGWVAAIGTAIAGVSFTEYFFPGQSFWARLGIFNVFFVMFIPVLLIALSFFRAVFRTRVSRHVRTGLGIFWILNIVGFFALGTTVVAEFSQEGTATRETELDLNDSDTLHLDLSGRNIPASEGFSAGPFWVDGEEFPPSDNARLFIFQSEDDRLLLRQETKSRGRDRQEAIQLAEEIAVSPQLEGNKLMLPYRITTREGQKWRAPEASFTLYIPVGKYVQIGETASYNVFDLQKAPGQDDIRLYRNPDRLWKMEKDGLRCITCDEEKDLSEQFTFRDFSTLNIAGPMKVFIERGENFEVRLAGMPQYTQKVTFKQNDDQQLSVLADLTQTASPVRLYVILPNLSQLHLDKTDDVRIDGFEEEQMTVTANGPFEVKMEGQANQLELNLNDNTRMDISGDFQNLKASLVKNCKLDAERASVGDAKLTMTDHSQAKFDYLQNKPDLEKDESSTLTIKNQ